MALDALEEMHGSPRGPPKWGLQILPSPLADVCLHWEATSRNR